jgi:RNase P/RNase MRP subunit p30
MADAGANQQLIDHARYRWITCALKLSFFLRDLMRGEAELSREIFENLEPSHHKKRQIAFEHPQL